MLLVGDGCAAGFAAALASRFAMLLPRPVLHWLAGPPAHLVVEEAQVPAVAVAKIGAVIDSLFASSSSALTPLTI